MNKNHSILFTLSAVCALAMGGCSMAPDYSRPESPVPGAWPSTPAAGQADNATAAPWRVSRIDRKDFFADEKLQRVIDHALANNRDLRVAALNVERARALYGIQRAEILPSIAASAEGGKQRVPKGLSSTGQATTVEAYQANLGLSAWEIDFFGRIRSLSDAALQQYLASEQAQRSARIMLVYQVAGTYLLLAADNETLGLARTTLQNQQAAHDLVAKRVTQGMASDLDLRRAEAQVESARADVARFMQVVAQDGNALDLLVGRRVPSELLPADLKGVAPLKDFEPGLSSEVLLERPDVLQAEAVLKAANANIGAARAAFFPRISLTATVGVGSNELSGLFKSGSGAWSFAPQIVMPIFDPRLGPALKATEVEKKTAIAQYEKAIQTAFREVADALAVCEVIDRQIAAEEALVNATADAYRLSNVRYDKGIDSYLSVLDAQRSLYGAQQQLVALRLAKVANQVKLYAALGGGGQSEPTVQASR